MALLGLGILIATLSFLCYKNPPTGWSFLPWLVRDTALRVGERDDKEGEELPRLLSKSGDLIEQGHGEGDYKEEGTQKQETVNMGTISNTSSEAAATIGEKSKRVAEDRKAMPPPSMLLPKSVTIPAPSVVNPPSPPDTPKAAASTPSLVPSFSLSNDDDDDNDNNEELEPTSQFPALNSVQRASGSSTRMGPPSLHSIQVQPPLRSPTLMSPPMRSPLPNRLPPGLDPGRNISNPISKGPPPTKTSSLSPLKLGGEGLLPPPSHTTIPAKPRKKVLLSPGHSPLDWATLSRDPTANLNGLPSTMSYLRVPPSLLKQMNGRPIKGPEEKSLLTPARYDSKGRELKDVWTVLSGKVYNITSYIPYHPGGEPELLKCAGRDGTKLFGEVHPWVNWEGMLESCLVGVAVAEEEIKKAAISELEDMD